MNKNTMSRKIGYARVSTVEQNLAFQVTALKAAGCDEIYQDGGISGAEKRRPALDAALGALREGDTLIVWRLDRLGRSLRHLIEFNTFLEGRGCAFESLTEKIDTSTAMGEFVFHILGAVAQLEREIIRERTLAGMAEAAKEGRLPGRPRQKNHLMHCY
ncbi:MAG: recombinase family protein [Pseudomonadota bacterium]